MLLRQKSTIDHQKLFLQNFENKLWTFIAEKFPVLCNNISGSFLRWLRLHLLGKQNMPCSCIKHKFRAIHICRHYGLYFITIFFRAQNDRFKFMEPGGAFFAWSRPNLAGVGSGTSDSGSAQKFVWMCVCFIDSALETRFFLTAV